MTEQNLTQNDDVLDVQNDENLLKQNENLTQNLDESLSKNDENLSENKNQNDERFIKKSDENLLDKSDEVTKLTAKNRELLGKLKASKQDLELSQSKISELQKLNDELQQVKSDFEEYKKTEYLEAVFYNVIDVLPSSRDYMEYELSKRGYKVIYADNEPLKQREICKDSKKETYKTVFKTGYCFVNADNVLVDRRELYEIRERFPSHCYTEVRGSGTGSDAIDLHWEVKELCEYKDGVFIGRPKVKEQVTKLVKFFKSELEKKQKAVDYYNAQIPALLETADRLPNQTLSDDDRLHFGLE
ncbi:hypothetical protein LU293_03950 [Moraxella nasovis]|uniref:hypothetical protein n=1 Tax=Moraxella nasovis TaxID=2904121 RepID=UPI001F600808|nr:hypothetical protein [Moraxella nasovis]UNU74054.1 hypothetical protein LU293_03950 [Moraxella nasovis]